MNQAILTVSELNEIETRMKSGTVTDEDIQLLLSTCRHLLPDMSSDRKAPKLKGARAQKVVDTQTVGTGSAFVEIFTDGACQGNPGPGGWGAIVRAGGVEEELSGGERRTTNNRMELIGVIEALKSLQKPCKVVLTTDSQYVQKGITAWIGTWKRNGWKTANKEPVKNRDLWLELDELNRGHEIEWKWIRGHNGHADNERCDELARKAAAES